MILICIDVALGIPHLCLCGTVPIKYKNTNYAIPVIVFIPPTYPSNYPIVKVIAHPASNIILTPGHKKLDSVGKYNISLTHWDSNSNITDFIWILQSEFSDDPPVRAKPIDPKPVYKNGPNPGYPQSYPNGNVQNQGPMNVQSQGNINVQKPYDPKSYYQPGNKPLNNSGSHPSIVPYYPQNYNPSGSGGQKVQNYPGHGSQNVQPNYNYKVPSYNGNPPHKQVPYNNVNPQNPKMPYNPQTSYNSQTPYTSQPSYNPQPSYNSQSSYSNSPKPTYNNPQSNVSYSKPLNSSQHPSYNPQSYYKNSKTSYNQQHNQQPYSNQPNFSQSYSNPISNKQPSSSQPNSHPLNPYNSFNNNYPQSYNSQSSYVVKTDYQPSPSMEAVSQLSQKMDSLLKNHYVIKNSEYTHLQKEKALLERENRSMQQKINDIDNTRDRHKKELEQLNQSIGELRQWIDENDTVEELDIDVVTTPKSKKKVHLQKLMAEDISYDEILFYLDEALRKGVVDISEYLKTYREISSQQYLCRALIKKISGTYQPIHL